MNNEAQGEWVMWFYECREPCKTSAAAADLDGGCCLEIGCMFYDTSRCVFSNGVAVIGVFHCRSQIDLEVGLLLGSVPIFYSFIQINISLLLTCAYTALACMVYFYLMKEKNTKITEVRSFSFFKLCNCVVHLPWLYDPNLTPLLGICQKWRRLLLAFNITPIKNLWYDMIYLSCK